MKPTCFLGCLVVVGFAWTPSGAVEPRAAAAPAAATNPCCIPTARTDWASGSHAAMLKREKRPDAQVVFLGDSITMMWRSQSGYEGGTPVWQQHYAPLHAANLGISGDRTQNVLWRITEGGDLDGLNPKVLVLLIGINNFHQGKNTPEQTAQGVARIVEVVQQKLPYTRILLLGLFPAGQKPDHPWRGFARGVNARISKLADGRRVFYLDLWDRFVNPDGTISKAIFRDYLHLSEKGYAVWAEAMKPYLDDLLTGDGQGAVWRSPQKAGQ